MAYAPKQVLFVEQTNEGYMSTLEEVYTNGKMVRSDRGQVISLFGNQADMLEYVLLGEKGLYHGRINDTVMSERIIRYIRDYYGKHLTNCSSFAHFVSTGTFIECQFEQRFAVVEHGMRPFFMASRVDVGDVVWIAYANPRYFRSRVGNTSMRKRYVEAQKQYRATGDFSAVVETVPRSKEPEQILALCKNHYIKDYHFMVCVAHEQGKPVWLFQNGYHEPGESHSSFGMTVGLTNPYRSTPLFAYIKKRR